MVANIGFPTAEDELFEFISQLWQITRNRSQTERLPGAAPLSVGDFPLPAACPGPTADTYFCDPETLLTAEQAGAVRKALGNFSAAVPCGAESVAYRLGVVVASSLGVPPASFFKGEYYRTADRLYDRWKPGLTDGSCHTGGLIVLLTDLRYVLVRTGGCDYLTNDAAQKVVNRTAYLIVLGRYGIGMFDFERTVAFENVNFRQ